MKKLNMVDTGFSIVSHLNLKVLGEKSEIPDVAASQWIGIPIKYRMHISILQCTVKSGQKFGC